MSRISNQISYLLSITSISYMLLLGTHEAAAQYVTSLGQAPSQVRLCPSRKCLQIFEHTFVRGKKIVIYETKNGWVRLSGPIASEQLQARFPGKKLPTNAAFWIPSAELPPTAAAQFYSEEVKPKVDKKPKPVGYTKLPKSPSLPTPRPPQKIAAKAEIKPAPKATPKPVEPETKKAASPSVDQSKKAEVKQALVETKAKPETKTEPKVETDSFGNPIVKLPSKLTKELKDKRLATLPVKPQNGLDLKAIITIRYHGLRLLNDGSCKGIQEGGKSLSLVDWIYVVCEGDGQYRQFPVQ